jgi:ubiquinone/menaquinone biosynthesis C-methylase UbiE
MTARRGFRKLLVVLAVIVALAGLAWLNRDWLVARAYLWLLESDWRVERLQIERVIEALEIEPGQSIADIGAGTGVFTRPFARAVGPDGEVYAVDINAELLEHVEQTAREQGLDNVRTILAAADDPMLPRPVDLVFFCDALHHIDGPGDYLKVLPRYLLPSGRLAVIDFKQGESPHWDPDMKLSVEQLDHWAREAGFELDSSHAFVDENYFRIYRCSACPG